MAQEPLANEGNFLHIYDFRVKPGTGDEFITLFNKFDYSGHNPMHASQAQVKDGFVALIEGGKFVPSYGKVVSATPAEYLRGGR